MTEDSHSLYELGWDDGYEAVKQSRIAEDFPHPDEYPDYRRGFWDGMKAAREEDSAAQRGGSWRRYGYVGGLHYSDRGANSRGCRGPSSCGGRETRG